jgi:hypothetical protein
MCTIRVCAGKSETAIEIQRGMRLLARACCFCLWHFTFPSNNMLVVRVPRPLANSVSSVSNAAGS